MRISLAAAVTFGMALLFGAADGVRADDHLLTARDARARLVEAEAARQGDLATVDRLLSSPPAAEAARKVGADLDAVRRAVPTLSDADLHDLAARAAALQADPVAGVSDNDLRWALYIFLIVAIVILVIKAVD
jgi:hypothetical protein